jgi:hypothetical protein
MASKAKQCDQPAGSIQPGLPAVYYPLHSLLHTLRALDSHGDQICTLLTDIQRSGKVSASLRKELAGLLHDLPSAALLSELKAVFSALEAA